MVDARQTRLDVRRGPHRGAAAGEAAPRGRRDAWGARAGHRPGERHLPAAQHVDPTIARGVEVLEPPGAPTVQPVRIQTSCAEPATLPGVLPIPCVRSTRAWRGSIRDTVSLLRLSTQSRPAPAVIGPGASSTWSARVTVLVRGSITATESTGTLTDSGASSSPPSASTATVTAATARRTTRLRRRATAAGRGGRRPRSTVRGEIGLDPQLDRVEPLLSSRGSRPPRTARRRGRQAARPATARAPRAGLRPPARPRLPRAPDGLPPPGPRTAARRARPPARGAGSPRGS